MGGDVEKMLVAEQVISRNLYRSGSHVGDIVPCRFGILEGERPAWGEILGWRRSPCCPSTCPYHRVTFGI